MCELTSYGWTDQQASSYFLHLQGSKGKIGIFFLSCFCPAWYFFSCVLSRVLTRGKKTPVSSLGYSPRVNTREKTPAFRHFSGKKTPVSSLGYLLGSSWVPLVKIKPYRCCGVGVELLYNCTCCVLLLYVCCVLLCV